MHGLKIAISTWVVHVDTGAAMLVGVVGSVWEVSMPSAQICCEPKIAVKNKKSKKERKKKRER